MATYRERGIRKLAEGRWQYAFRGPDRKWHRHIVTSMKEAQAKLDEVRLGIRAGTYQGPGAERRVKLEEAIPEFLNWSKANKRASTYHTDERCTREWAMFPRFRGKYLDAITPLDIEAFKVWRSEQLSKKNKDKKNPQKVSKRTVDISLRRLKRLFSLCIQWGLVVRNPSTKVQLFNEDSMRVRMLTADEEERLMGVASPYLRRIILFALHTGMRRGEILGLRWVHVDFTASRASVPSMEAKGRRDRHIHLNQTALGILRDLPVPLDRTVLVFGNGEGNLQNNFHRIWSTAVAKAKIQDFRFHDLRHTFASRLAMNGVDLLAIKELLGHRTLAMTLRYAHLTQGHLQKAVAVLDRPLQSALQSGGRGVEEAEGAFA